MNLPTILDSRTLKRLAAPGETHVVRVVLLKISNSGAYRLRGRRRQYIFERDGRMGAHVLDVPLSVWMDDVPAGSYRENFSIAHELQPTAALPLIILVVPADGAETAASASIPAPAEEKPKSNAERQWEFRARKKAEKDAAAAATAKTPVTSD